MDSTAEEELAGFHQNNLWRRAALMTTGPARWFFNLLQQDCLTLNEPGSYMGILV